MRFRGKNFLRDKRGDAMAVFIIFLFFLFGMMLMGYSNVLRTSITRQKLYNAVQDGLTLARAQAVKTESNQVRFDSQKAYSLIKQCLDNNNIKIEKLEIRYSGGRIYTSGETAGGTPFTFSIQVYRNFR